MKKTFKMDKLPPNIQAIVDQYIEAKQALYDYDEETLNKKVSNLYKNVKKIIVTDKLQESAEGYYNETFKNIVLLESTQEEGVNISTLIHELNHAWNTDKSRTSIIPQKWKQKKKDKYTKLNEIINEAETQILIENKKPEDKSEVKILDGDFVVGIKAPSRFNAYPDVECLFETLVTVSNSTPIEFLKGIEGKDIEGIISFMAEKTGHSKERITEYIDVIAENTSDSKENKQKTILESFREIYDESQKLIDESSLDKETKEACQEKLSCTQDRLILTTGIYNNYMIRERRKYETQETRFKLTTEEDKEKIKKIKEESTRERGIEKFLSKAREIIKHPEYSKKNSPFVQPDWGDGDIKKIDVQAIGKLTLLDYSAYKENIFRKIKERINLNKVPRLAAANATANLEEVIPATTIEEEMPKLTEVNETEEIDNYYIESEENMSHKVKEANELGIED